MPRSAAICRDSCIGAGTTIADDVQVSTASLACTGCRFWWSPARGAGCPRTGCRRCCADACHLLSGRAPAEHCCSDLRFVIQVSAWSLVAHSLIIQVGLRQNPRIAASNSSRLYPLKGQSAGLQLQNHAACWESGYPKVHQLQGGIAICRLSSFFELPSAAPPTGCPTHRWRRA